MPSWSVRQFSPPVTMRGGPLPDGRNTTAADRFVVIGDAGTGDQGQYQVSGQMNQWWRKLPFSSVLVLGDNVYPKGDPEAFNERIFQPYQALFRQGIRFWPVLGNHDVKAGFGDRQLAYWGVPPYYSFKLGRPGTDVEIFALDTTAIASGYLEKGQGNPAQMALREKEQAVWLENALANSTASMKVVMGHYPMYSRGVYAKVKRLFWQRALETKLAPILRRYQVDLYLAGHEHHYEAPVYRDGVRYALSGAGGKLDSPTKGVSEGHGLVKKNHFMLFENTPAGLNYRAISAQGDIFDFGLIPRKRPFPQSAAVASTGTPNGQGQRFTAG